MRALAIAVSLAATVATLTVAAAPAQAYDTLGGFVVRTHISGLGWIDGPGTKGRGLGLEAISVRQTTSEQICLRAHVAAIGWQTTQCSTGKGSTVTVGTTGRALAIQAVEVWIPTRALTVTTHIQSIGDQTATTTTKGRHLTVGTTGRGLQMEWFYLSPHAN